MIRDGKGKVRLTKSEFNSLRAENAKNGVVIGEIRTDEDLLTASINGLPDHLLNDMLEFFETGGSPLTRQGRNERSNVNTGKRED